MIETFKPIKELKGLYSISNKGRVFCNRKNAIKNEQDNGRGYKQLYCQINGKRKLMYVHRLVASYFIGTIKPGYQVNHIDADKSNNNVNNLEIVTAKENINHAKINNLLSRGESSGTNKLTECQVMAIQTIYNINNKFNRTEVSKLFGVADTCICRIVKGKRWSHLNYRLLIK